MPVLTTDNQAAANASVNVPLAFVYLDIAGDPAWAWSGHGNLTITSASDPLLAGGATFIGVGEIGAIGQVTHAADGSIQAMQLSLSQVDMTTGDAAAFCNDVSAWSQRRAVVWKGFGRNDGAGGVLIDTPFRVMTARMTHVALVNGSKASLAVKLATQAATDGQRASGWQLADAHQQRFFAGDAALSYIPALMQKELRFGVRDNTPGVVGPVDRSIGPQDQGGQRWTP